MYLVKSLDKTLKKNYKHNLLETLIFTYFLCINPRYASFIRYGTDWMKLSTFKTRNSAFQRAKCYIVNHTRSIYQFPSKTPIFPPKSHRPPSLYYI